MRASNLKDTKRQFLLKYMNHLDVGAEIGVWKGEFSELVLSHRNLSRYYLIDPWEFQPEHKKTWYGGLVAKSQSNMNDVMNVAKSRLERFDNTVFLRQFSSDASNSIDDLELDWVYIDGNHHYEYVLEDLKIYYKKVKTGGYLICDDYNWADENGNRCVKQAIVSFLAKNTNKVALVEIEHGQAVLIKLA